MNETSSAEFQSWYIIRNRITKTWNKPNYFLSSTLTLKNLTLEVSGTYRCGMIQYYYNGTAVQSLYGLLPSAVNKITKVLGIYCKVHVPDKLLFKQQMKINLFQFLIVPSAPVVVQSFPTGSNLEADIGTDVILSCQVNETFPTADILWTNQKFENHYIIIINMLLYLNLFKKLQNYIYFK